MQTEEREIELIDYIEVVLKRKWLILLGTLACVAGAVVYQLASASVVPLYTASAQIFIVPAQLQTQNKELTDTQIEISTLTPDFYQSVAVSDEIRLAMNKLQQACIDSLDLKAPGRLALEAKVVDNTRLEMQANAADTLLARLVLYAWVDTFMARTQQLNATESERFYTYIAAQYDTARKNLERAENDLMKSNRDHPIASLQNQQRTYFGQFSSTQNTTILTQIRLEQQATQLRRAKEFVQALEIDGEPLYTQSAMTLPTLRERVSSDLARQLIDNTIKLQNLRDKQNKMEEHYNLALLSFDQENDYARLQRATDALAKSSVDYQSSYMQAISKERTSSTNLKALEAEIQKHPPTFKVSGDQVGQAAQKNGPDSELNPAYVALEKKLAEEGLTYERARLYAETGAQELKDLEVRLEEAQRPFYSVKARRQKLVAEMEKMKGELKGRIDGAQTSVDAIVQSYLASKKSIGDLEIQVVSLKNQLADQQAQLARLNEQTQTVQDLLSSALTDSVRLAREKETYTATFERFARLSEEARIAQQKANTNLRIITRDVTAKAAGVEDSRKKVLLSGVVGLLLSTFLAFLLEYLHRVRVQRAKT